MTNQSRTATPVDSLNIGQLYRVVPFGEIPPFIGLVDEICIGRPNLYRPKKVLQVLFTTNDEINWCLYGGEFEAIPSNA